MTDEEYKLHKYLLRYKDTKRNKQMLEKTIQDIAIEYRMPIKAMVYDGMPKSSSIGSQVESIFLKLEEAESKLMHQADECAKVMNEVIDIISLLPRDSSMSRVLWLSYINCMSPNEISDILSIDRATFFRWREAGLEKLLEIEEIKTLFTEIKKSKENNK